MEEKHPYEGGAPFLPKARKNAGMEAPEGYFEGLGDQVMERIATQEAPRLNSSRRYYWVAAAGIAAIFTGAALVWFRGTPEPSLTGEQWLAQQSGSVSSEEVMLALAQDVPSEQEILRFAADDIEKISLPLDVSGGEVQQFLSEETPAGAASDEDLMQLLDEMSDEELEQMLEEQGFDAEEILRGNEEPQESPSDDTIPQNSIKT